MKELFEVVPAPLVIGVFVLGIAVTLLACLPTAWVGRVVDAVRKLMAK